MPFGNSAYSTPSMTRIRASAVNSCSAMACAPQLYLPLRTLPESVLK